MTGIENQHVADPASEVAEPQIYGSPEVVDLGKASDLLQGGSRYGMDNFYQTQW